MSTSHCQTLCEPLVSYHHKLTGRGREKRRFYLTLVVATVCILAAVCTAILIVNSNMLHYPSFELRSLVSTKKIVAISPLLEQAALHPNFQSVIEPQSGVASDRDRNYLLLIIVDSDPDAVGERMTARNSWIEFAKSFEDDVLVRFAIAASNSEISAQDLDRLIAENQLHQDMLIFRHMSALPESEVILFEMIWAEYNIAYSFLMKTRDNFYLHLPKILQEVEQLDRAKSNVYWGYFEGHRSPQFDGQKHKEPEWFLCDTYIRFAHSGAYVLSQNLVKRLVSQVLFLHPYVNEDVAMGTWLSPYDDIEWKHDVRFDSEIGNTRGCSSSFLVFQGSRNLDLNIVHQHIAMGEKNLICNVEHVSSTYWYDFNTLPSHCCRDVSM